MTEPVAQRRAGANRFRSRRGWAMGAVAVLACAGLSACSDELGQADPQLVRQPRRGRHADRAAPSPAAPTSTTSRSSCCPSGATDQRTQLARRLAAEDSSTDLMSLDPVFVAEFANADWLERAARRHRGGGHRRRRPRGRGRDRHLGRRGLRLPAVGQHPGALVPQVARRGRRARHDPAGHLGPGHRRRRGERRHRRRPGQQVRGLRRARSTRSSRARAATSSRTPRPARTPTIDIDSEAGREAATVIQKLAESTAAQPDLTVVQRGHQPGPDVRGGPGEFMTNWTFVYQNYKGLIETGDITEEDFDDLGWARYPETVEGEESKPPIGGIDIGVGAYSKHPDFALEAAACVTSSEAQVDLAVNEGLMPSRNSAYESPELAEAYPPDLLGALPRQRRQRRTAAQERLLRDRSRPPCRACGTRRPRSTLTRLPRSRRSSSATSSTGRHCCDDHGDRTARPSGTQQARDQRPGPGREPAGPEAGRPGHRR